MWGVIDRKKNVIHLGARLQFIENLVSNLFRWLNESTTHEIIKSCVFHYELVYINRFEGGNERLSGLWQSVMLTKWNPLFAWVPVESIIYKHQKEYYDALMVHLEENNKITVTEFSVVINKSISTLNLITAYGENKNKYYSKLKI